MADSRALLANVDVFFAEGNIRRGVSNFANNMLSTTENGAFQERRLTLLHGTSEVIKSIDGNAATIIRTTKPIKVTANVLPSGSPTVFTVNSLFIYTGELGDVTVANESLTADAKVSFLQI